MNRLAGNKTPIPWISTVTVFLLLSFSSLSFGTPFMGTAHQIKLETDVWTAEDIELYSLEKRLVREVQLNSRSTFYHYLLSQLYVRILATEPSNMALMKQAADLAQQAIDLDQKSEFGYIALSQLLDLMGHTTKALALIDEAVKSGVEDSWRMMLTRARLSIDHKPSQDSLALLKRALKSPGAINDVIIPYVIAIMQTTDTQSEISELEKWQKDYPHNMFIQLLAIKNTEQGNYKEAHKLYQTIYADNANEEAKINDGILLYRHLKQPKKAISLLKEVSAIKDSKFSDETQSVLYAHLAAAQLEMKQYKESRVNFVKSAEFSASPASLSSFIEFSFKGKNANEELVLLIKDINNALPGSAIMHGYLGEILSENLNRHFESLEYFTNAITLDPSKSEFYNAMGLAYFRMENFNDALNLFSAATKVNPGDATARYNQACAFAKLNQNDSAIASLKEALELDPNLQNTARSDQDFAAIHSNPKFKALISVSTVAH